MANCIAEFSLIGQKADNAPFPVTVCIFQPVLSTKMLPAWECYVSVKPFHNDPFPIYGEDSFQSLCLAARLAVQTLSTFVEKGGELLNEDGELFEAGSFGFQLFTEDH